jgi:hypothetical protein
MLEEITGVNGETVHKILAVDLKKKWCAHFIPHLLTLDKKHQRADSSAESAEMIDKRNVLKQKVKGDESCMSNVNNEPKGVGLYSDDINIFHHSCVVFHGFNSRT